MPRDKKQHTPADSAVITEGETKWEGRDRGGEREEGVIILPLCLSVITGEHTDMRGPRH